MEYNSNKKKWLDNQKVGESYNLPNTCMWFSTKRKKMIIFHWENQRFDSRWSNDFLQTRCLGALAINVLIYAEKLKSKTNI